MRMRTIEKQPDTGAIRLAEALDAASMVINEMVVTEDRDERYALAVAFKKQRRRIEALYSGAELFR